MGGTQPLIPEQLACNARWSPDKPALVLEDEVLTWAEFDLRTRKVAAALDALGLDQGDRVAFVATNSIELAVALMGVVRAAMVVVPLNVTISDADMRRMFDDSGARAVFVTADHANRVARLLEDAPAIGGEARIALQPAIGWRTFDELMDVECDDGADCGLRPDLPFNIIYSSGTTSVPKGIVHTQGGRLEFCVTLSLELRMHRNSVTLCALGLFSNISWTVFLCTLYLGGTVVLMRRFDPSEFLRLAAAHRATFTAMVPLQFAAVLATDAISSFHLGSFETVMSCGSPLAIELKRKIASSLRCLVMELYGLTEGFATVLQPEESAARPGSVGKPIVGMDMRLVGKDGRDVPVGEDGEIWGTSASLMNGYHNNSRATDEAIYVDERGRRWMRTGDVGRLDADGCLYIVGRIKEMILSGGQNIYPTDLEAVLMTHEGVDDAAVVGMPHDKWGETPVAFVVAHPGSAATEAEVLNWANERLGRRQRIAALHFIDELPRNDNGKVQRVKLKERLNQ